MIMTIILHSVDPICRPLYVDGSSAFPFIGPFHNVTSLEWPQLAGIACVCHIVLYNSVSSSRNSLLSIACLTNATGMSFDAFPFLSFLLFLSTLSHLVRRL